MRLKILGQEVSLPLSAATAITVDDASEVRLMHDEQGNTTHLITITDGAATPTTVGSFSMAPGQSLVIRKLPTEKLYAGSDDIRAVKVSYIA